MPSAKMAAAAARPPCSAEAPPPSWLRAARTAEVALPCARGVPGGSGASGAGRWERRGSEGMAMGMGMGGGVRVP